MKGRLLNEPQVAALVRMLVDTPVIFDVSVIDMGMQTVEAVVAHRDRQCVKLSESLGPEHKPELVAQIEIMKNRLAATSPQLYVQSRMIFNLIWKSLQHSTLLYSQRLPSEIGSASWMFDAKGRDKLTDWEDWWRSMMAPILQSIGRRVPLIALTEGDYSFFDRSFQVETSPWFRDKFETDETHGTSLGLVFSDFEFESGINFGLEMVDVLTNAVRRALSGRFDESGWGEISKLIPRMRDKHRVQLCSFVQPNDSDLPYGAVIRKFDKYSKRLLI